MHKVYQTRSGVPHGNCFSACLASILEVPLGEVPDPRWPEDVPFTNTTPEGQAYSARRYRVWQEWTRTLGLGLLTFRAGPEDGFMPGYAIKGVQSPRGPHAVVALDGKTVWDPNPAQDSYDAPVEEWTFFVAMEPQLVPRSVMPGTEASDELRRGSILHTMRLFAFAVTMASIADLEWLAKRLRPWEDSTTRVSVASRLEKLIAKELRALRNFRLGRSL